MNKKVNYGIIGCGKHALGSHALVIKDSDIFNLAALCDISEDSMKNFEDKCGKEVLKYTEEDQILDSDIDAVIISTPDKYHSESMRKALEKGKHTFVEKPLATTEEDLQIVEECIKIAKQKGLVLTSCHPRRYDPPFVWLKENNPEMAKILGNVTEFDFNFSYHKPSKDWKHERGLLMDHINHEIDLVHFMLGYSDFEAKKLIDTYDSYHAIIKRKDGIECDFSGTRRLEERKYDEFVKVKYERGEVHLDANIGEVLITDYISGVQNKISIPARDYDERSRKTTINFGETILGVAPNYLSGKDLYINTALSVMLTVNNEYKFTEGMLQELG